MTSRLSEISRDLVHRDWVPSSDEIALGNAFLERSRRLMDDPQPADAPEVPHHPPLRIVGLAYRDRLAGEVREELLPLWRDRLTHSPMLELVTLYAQTVRREVSPVAERLADAWQESPPAPPSPDLIASETKRLSISAEEAERVVRYYDAWDWEAELIDQRERETLDAATSALWSTVGVITAAVTGDVDH